MNLNVQWASFWVNVFLAVITFLAVLVALFGQSYWDSRKKPIIKIGFGNKEPYSIYFSSRGHGYLLFRLKIINLGKTVAKNCRVKIISVFPESQNKDTHLIEEPDVLKWSNAPKDQRYYTDERGNDSTPIHKEFKHITPEGGWEFCDFFKISTEEKRVIFCSSGTRNFLAEGNKYVAVIEISGDNLKPVIKKIIFCVPYKVDFSDSENIRFILAGIEEVKSASLKPNPNNNNQ